MLRTSLAVSFLVCSSLTGVAYAQAALQDGTYQIKARVMNKKLGVVSLCMAPTEIEGGNDKMGGYQQISEAAGARVGFESCTDTKAPFSEKGEMFEARAQHFLLAKQADGFYTLKNSWSDKCIEVPTASQKDRNGPTQVSDCNGATAQKWKVEAAEGGYYNISSSATGMLLTAVFNDNLGFVNQDAVGDSAEKKKAQQFKLIFKPDASWEYKGGD